MNLAEILETARAIAREILAPNAEAVDAEARWPGEGLRALQTAGLGGLVVPRDSGGLGLGLSAVAQVCEVLGQACASTALCFGMHCVGTAMIAAKATDAQRRRYLEPISRGEHLTTLALSEPGTGSHFYVPQVKLARRPGGFTVTGLKSFVTNGGFADSYVVSTAAADPSAPPGQFSCVVVPAGAPGLSWGPEWSGWGMRGNSARSLDLEGVFVPQEDLLGSEGDEIWYVFNVVAPYFLMAMAGTYLGIATAALEETRRQLGRRRYTHDGRLLAQLPLIQHRLGTLWGQLERTRTLIRTASVMGDTGAPDALLALCSAKAEVGECAESIASEGLTLLGGQAYGQNTPLQRHLRDARAAHVMAPTTDLLRVWVGRALLGQPLLGD